MASAVAVLVASTLTARLPTSTVIKSGRGWVNKRAAARPPGEPSRSARTWLRLNENSAASEPEKNADSSRRTTSPEK